MRKNVSLIIAILSIFAAGILLPQTEGIKIADVYKFDTKTGELIVSSPKASSDIKMGDLLYMRIEGKVVLLRASFPMMTTAKCKPEGKNYMLWAKARKGMPVFRFKDGIEDTAAVVAQTKIYKIGDRGPSGGWIFYDKGNFSDGWRYLEAAYTDQSSDIKWIKKAGQTGSIDSKIGTGRLNTQKIIKTQGDGYYAAKICADYKGGGKTDWFLPSKDELNLMYNNLRKAGVGGLVNSLYWSSSESSANNAWFQDFSNGKQESNDSVATYNALSFRTRAVRAVRDTDKEGEGNRIGERGPAGGWIFYNKGSYSDGWRYLEAAPVDQSNDIKWKKGIGGFDKFNEIDDRLGFGESNTQKIIEAFGNGSYAAKICVDYRGGGKDDWFLPSKDELNLMYINLHKAGVGGFAKQLYWSSSKGKLLSTGSGWVQDFQDGTQYSTYSRQEYEGDPFRVRAIRAF